jgi:uncharacterized alpha/beta hydrolase family protein
MKTQKVSKNHQSTKTYFFLFIALWLLWALMIQPVVIAQEGKLEWREIHSPALEGNLIGDPATRPFAIYLPPSYENSDKRYPAIYVLHGSTGNAGSMTSIKPVIDNMIRNGDIGEMIAVFVKDDHFSTRSYILQPTT